MRIKGHVDSIRVILNNNDDSAKRRSPSDAVGRVEKSTDFSTLSTVRRRPAVGRVEKSTDLFHAFHSP